MKIGDNFNVHKKIKEAAKVNSKTPGSILTDVNGNLITTLEDKFERWRQYLEKDLFHDVRPENHGITFYDSGPSIMITEVQKAISHPKNRKAEGPDEIPTELLKALANSNCITHLTELFNAIYNTGYIPKDWLLSTFVAIPKKANAKKCSDMSYTLKIILKIIHSRIYKKTTKKNI